MELARVTYNEVRWWAVWLETFTARDMANALRVDLSQGERAVRALLHHGICEDTGDTFEGPDGEERIIRYKPLPKGPRVHPRETPPEIVVVREAGGDPLRVPRGLPVNMQTGRRKIHSRVGNWHPGRTQGPSRKKKEEPA